MKKKPEPRTKGQQMAGKAHMLTNHATDPERQRLFAGTTGLIHGGTT